MEKKSLDNPKAAYWIGLDVGGTKIEALAAAASGEPAFRIVTPIDVSHARSTLDSIIQAVRAVLAAGNIPLSQVRAAGLGIPGQVQGGFVRMAVNLNLVEYPLADALEAEFGLPFILENDVRVGAVGAYQYLKGMYPVKSMVYLSVGTGIAAGLVVDGELYRGAHQMAGEVGHIVVDPSGERCKCGLYGCLETVCAGPAIAAQADRAISAGQPTRLSSNRPVRTEQVYQAAAEGDPLALAIVERSGAYLARAIQSLILSYDVEKVVLGGGVSHAGESFLRPVLAELARMRASSSFAAWMLAEDKLVLLPKDFNPGSWGAWAQAQSAGQL